MTSTSYVSPKKHLFRYFGKWNGDATLWQMRATSVPKHDNLGGVYLRGFYPDVGGFYTPLTRFFWKLDEQRR